jgi:hypothetical protein
VEGSVSRALLVLVFVGSIHAWPAGRVGVSGMLQRDVLTGFMVGGYM